MWSQELRLSTHGLYHHGEGLLKPNSYYVFEGKGQIGRHNVSPT